MRILQRVTWCYEMCKKINLNAEWIYRNVDESPSEQNLDNNENMEECSVSLKKKNYR